MKVLVTGSAGMIGSNLVGELLRSGHDVIGVDNFWRGSRETVGHQKQKFPQRYEFFDRDLRDPNALDGTLEDVGHVFHLADVVAGIQFVFGNEFFVWQNNMAINSNVLSSLIRSGIPSVTYVGTACSYPQSLTSGHKSARPLMEADAYPADPESAYGWSKLMGEYEIELAEKEGKVQASILRLHNVYGFPTELDSLRSQVIPALALKAARFPHEDFIVWGSGQQRRTFVYVRDVVSALVKSIDRGLGAGPIQIGASQSTSIAEVATKLIEISGKDIIPNFDISRPEGDGDRYPDLSRARDILGWEPQTSLRDGLREVYEWVAQKAETIGKL